MIKRDLLEELRQGKQLNNREQLFLTVQLSIPAIMAQISSVVMQYIDASMVGQLGAADSAAVGLVSSTTWLMGGLCGAAGIGFTVQVAHRIGAGEEKEARAVVRHGLFSVLIFSLILAGTGLLISQPLPVWLKGDPAVRPLASQYMMIFALGIPALQLGRTSAGMLQCSGNMRVPSILHIVMCGLDVIFNWFLIFPSRTISFSGRELTIPRAGLGIAGAALGTALAEICVAVLLLAFLLFRSRELRLRKEARIPFQWGTLKKAVQISLPVGIESAIMGAAYVMVTRIVSPLGTISLAANSFAVTAESLCYMPGYGIEDAATTLVGQSIGAGRRELSRKLGWITTFFGMCVMTGTGILMYVFAPQMIGIMTPDPRIRLLAVQMLRIEAFAEPLFAASIVGTGVFRGEEDTLVPTLLNFFSMWLVRLPLGAVLSHRMGLRGMWIAMCIELWVRGFLFLGRLYLKGKKARNSRFQRNSRS